MNNLAKGRDGAMSKAKTKAGARKSAKKSASAPTLEQSPSHLLHRALQLALDIYGEETGPDAVTQRQYAVLSAVAAHEGLTQTDLVRATGIDRSTLADLVARMIGKQLLGRERSTADARANTVRLTETGRAALDAAAPRVAAADERILKLLPARKREAFIGVLADLSRAAEDLVEDDAETSPKIKKAKKKPKAEKADKTAKAAKPAKVDKPAKAEKVAKTKNPKVKKTKGTPAPANAA